MGVVIIRIIIKTDKLCKSFTVGGKQLHIIKNLDLEIYEGDFTVIMGSSGSGKSTLLYAISGMDNPTLGEVFYGKEEISKFNNDQLAVFRRENCGFVFQQIHLMDNMSVMDNVLTSGLLLSNDKAAITEKAEKLFLKVGIRKELHDKFPSQLSGGEAQRTGIVRALINNPKVLFADEPTGSLNSASSKSVLDVITDVNDEGQSVITVTHDIKTAARGNRVLYLRDGAIVGELTLDKYSEGNRNPQIEKLQKFLDTMGW